MGKLILITLMLAGFKCNADPINLEPLLRAVAIQTGLDKEMSQFGQSVYNLLIPVYYQPYINVTVQIVHAVNTKEVYVSQKWEF